MITANVATAKNELSRLLRRVKRGERVIIMERNRPVAQLEPVSAAHAGAADAQLAALHELGLLTPPSGKSLDFKKLPPLSGPALAKGRGLADAVLAEREESR